MRQPKGRPTDEFAQFRDLTKRIISVPKAEIDRRAAENREQKKAARKNQLSCAALGGFHPT
jgi:hypothetical protein